MTPRSCRGSIKKSAYVMLDIISRRDLDFFKSSYMFTFKFTMLLPSDMITLRELEGELLFMHCIVQRQTSFDHVQTGDGDVSSPFHLLAKTSLYYFSFLLYCFTAGTGNNELNRVLQV